MKALCFSLVISLFLFTACHEHFPFQPKEADAGTFTLVARSSTIRSYPNGGGIFTIVLMPGDDFKGSVRLSVQADPALRCTLSLPRLDSHNRVVELCLAPTTDATITPKSIELRAWHGGRMTALPLTVDMYDWSHAEPGEGTMLLGRYLSWVHATHHELGTVDISPFQRYLTYPSHLIVEHWSFVNALWEVRICRHVMVPPGDWSMMLLRRRGTHEPILAARLDQTAAEIHEIPVSEYPILYGY